MTVEREKGEKGFLSKLFGKKEKPKEEEKPVEAEEVSEKEKKEIDDFREGLYFEESRHSDINKKVKQVEQDIGSYFGMQVKEGPFSQKLAKMINLRSEVSSFQSGVDRLNSLQPVNAPKELKRRMEALLAKAGVVEEPVERGIDLLEKAQEAYEKYKISQIKGRMETTEYRSGEFRTKPGYGISEDTAESKRLGDASLSSL